MCEKIVDFSAVYSDGAFYALDFVRFPSVLRINIQQYCINIQFNIIHYTVLFIVHHSINKIGEAKLTESVSESELQMVCDSKFSYVVISVKRSVRW